MSDSKRDFSPQHILIDQSVKKKEGICSTKLTHCEILQQISTSTSSSLILGLILFILNTPTLVISIVVL